MVVIFFCNKLCLYVKTHWCYLSPLPVLENGSKGLGKKKQGSFKIYIQELHNKYLFVHLLKIFANHSFHKLKIYKFFFFSTVAVHWTFCLLLQVEKLQGNYSFLWLCKTTGYHLCISWTAVFLTLPKNHRPFWMRRILWGKNKAYGGMKWVLLKESSPISVLSVLSNL